MDAFFEREPRATSKPEDFQVAHRDSGGYVVVEPVESDPDDPYWDIKFDDVAGPFKKMSSAERWIWRTCDRMLAEGKYSGRPWWRERVSYRAPK